MSEVSKNREAVVPNISVFEDKFTISSGLALSILHGLAGEPRQVQLFLQCISAENGYAVGDKVLYAPSAGDTSTLMVNATHVGVKFAALPHIAKLSDGTSVAITAAKWYLVIRAEL